MQNILVLINGDAGQDHRLRAGIDLAQALGGHITCLTVTADESMLGKAAGALSPHARSGGAISADTDGMNRIQGRLCREGVDWDWIQKPGGAASGLHGTTRYADMIVASGVCDRRVPGGRPVVPVEVFVHSNTPVIMTPFDGVRLDPRGRVLAAWDGEPLTLAAMRIAAPLLRLASCVEIAPFGAESVGLSADFAVRHLLKHGIRAARRESSFHDRTLASAMLHEVSGAPYEYAFVAGSRSRRLAQMVFAAGPRSPWSVTGVSSAALH